MHPLTIEQLTCLLFLLSPISMKAKPFNWILTYSYAHKSLQSTSYDTKQQFSIIILYGWKNLWVTVNFLPLCKIYFDFRFLLKITLKSFQKPFTFSVSHRVVEYKIFKRFRLWIHNKLYLDCHTISISKCFRFLFTSLVR